MNLVTAAQMTTSIGTNAAQLLKSVSDGALPAYRSDSDQVKLGELFFDCPDLRAYIEQFKKRNRLMSRNDAARRLCAKPATLMRWVGTGLLSPTVTYAHSPYFSVSDVNGFRDRYVTTAEAAEILGVHTLTAGNWVRQGLVTAMSGPDIDGSHRYLFDREYLSEWRRDHLTFDQARKLLGVSRTTLHRYVSEGKLQSLPDTGTKHRWFDQAAVTKLMRTNNIEVGGISCR